MKRAAPVVCVLLGLTAHSAAGTFTVYDNRLGSIFSSSTMPRRALDDGSFTPGPGAGGPVLVTALNVGYAVTGTGAGAMDIRVTFYDTLNASAPAGTPVNSNPLGQIVIPVQFTDSQPPVHDTGFVNFAPILFPDDSWLVDVEFLEPGTNTPSTRGTPLFAGGVDPNGPTIGSSLDRFWRDVNSNGIYESNELRTLGGAPNRANFYLALQTVPEPGTILLMTAGGALLIHRRRSRS